MTDGLQPGHILRPIDGRSRRRMQMGRQTDTLGDWAGRGIGFDSM